MLVDISLDRAHDNPQLIFESMNSTGLELSQADLIRNYVLMGLEPDRQEKLYNDYWRPMEMAFGQDAYSRHFDSFMRHYLTIKTGTIPKIGRVYEEFKTYSQKKDHTLVNVDTLLADLNKFANYILRYCPWERTRTRFGSSVSRYTGPKSGHRIPAHAGNVRRLP